MKNDEVSGSIMPSLSSLTVQDQIDVEKEVRLANILNYFYNLSIICEIKNGY